MSLPTIRLARPTTAQGLIAEHPNLVILHTLSKAFGAAGTRLGYVIAASEVIDVFAAIRQIYSVNVLSQAAALAVCVPRRVRARGGTGCIRARARAVRPARNGCRGPASGGMAECGELCTRTYVACHARARASARRVLDLVRDFSYALGSRTACASLLARRRKTMRCWLRLPRW